MKIVLSRTCVQAPLSQHSSVQSGLSSARLAFTSLTLGSNLVSGLAVHLAFTSLTLGSDLVSGLAIRLAFASLMLGSDLVSGLAVRLAFASLMLGLTWLPVSRRPPRLHLASARSGSASDSVFDVAV